MHPSVRCLTTRAHQPLIRFIGKRAYPSTRDVPYAHPAAPFELKQESVNKISKPQGSESTPTRVNSGYYHDLWDAPSRFWQPKVRQLEDAEMDAIMSGGASSY